MRQIVSGQPLVSTIENAPTGLVGTIGYRILDDEGTVVVPRTTDGIVEFEDSGFYIAKSPPVTLDLGIYSALWDIDAGGDVEEGNNFSEQFQVVAGVNLAPLPDATDPSSLCTLWVDAGSISSEVGGDAELALEYATVASEVLYEMSGMVFPGLCDAVARPCGGGPLCGWWGSPDGVRRYEYGDRPTCSCRYESSVLLPGPIDHIVSVTVDGVAITDYRVVGEELLRTDSVTWPLCQDMSAEDDAEGSFTVHYVRGQTPPRLGQWAALELAQWLIREFPAGGCSVPKAVISMQRQGVSFQFDPDAPAGIGLPMVSLFLSTYNPSKLRYPNMVFSPDLPRYADTH